MKRWLYILLLCLPFQVLGQHLNGPWEGNFPPTSFSRDTRKLIVTMNMEASGKITGTSYLDYGEGFFEHYHVLGQYDAKNKKLYLKEYLTIDVRLPPGSYNRLGSYHMKMVEKDNEITFEGEWRDNHEDEIVSIKPTKVYFKRLSPSSLSSRTPSQVKAPTTVTPKPARKPALQRTSDIQEIVTINKAEGDSIVLELFDNGEHDGDRVSLYLDNYCLVKNRIISEEPMIFHIIGDKKLLRRQLKLVAEDVGTTPPCTAYVRITTRNRQLGVSLKSEYNKNGTIELVWEQ